MNKYLLLLLATCASAFAQPAAPANATISGLATNVATPAAVFAPAGTFYNAAVYQPKLILGTAKVSSALWFMFDPSATVESSGGGYKFCYGDITASNAVPKTLSLPAGNTNIIVLGLDTNTTYYFYLTATNAAGESPKSNVLIHKPSPPSLN